MPPRLVSPPGIDPASGNFGTTNKMIITTDKQGDLAIVSINGRVDGATAPDLEGDLSSMIRGGDIRVLLDCGEMNYISSAGLRVFLLAAKRCKQAGGLLSISSLQPACKSVIEMGGFHTIIDCYDSREDALATNP